MSNPKRRSTCHLDWFRSSEPLIDDFILLAKNESEILRSDPDYVTIWPEFVVNGEKIIDFRADIPAGTRTSLERHIKRGTNLLHSGKELITWIANVRVPMPVSTKRYLGKCEDYKKKTQRFL